MFWPGWPAPVPDEPIDDGEITLDLGIEEGNAPNVVRCPECYNQRPRKDSCDFCNGRGRLKKVEETRTVKGVHTRYEAY